ncbi:antitoxin YezG family protein [Virgibacillus sp. MSJ-26]|uniref:immunity protein YezG family protein n=1 Tax=Virgibacillus sp. MSJ-26 TaxID=2841522 RepID=UPI001C11D259|nr:antitoxin YezG family protein [Virgibacillus sp. MSJ-26]
MEKQLQNIYQEIADTVNQMISEEWGKVYFYAQISETGLDIYFYYNTPENLLIPMIKKLLKSI